MLYKKKSGKSTKGKSQDMNWKDFTDPLYVAEAKWENKPKKVWDHFTYKKYVKMTHLSKLWPLDQVEVQVCCWEGPMSMCTSLYFVLQYEEITLVANLPVSKTNVINYLNMAMIWQRLSFTKKWIGAHLLSAMWRI